MSKFERYTVLLAVIIASLVGMLATSALADGMRDWACGSVILRYEMIDGPGYHQSRYTVINPDAINYIRSGGAPFFFVEWNSNPRGELVTLNGWPCTPLTMPIPKPRPKVSRAEPEVELCTAASKGEC
jgi:hypothetical protein